VAVIIAVISGILSRISAGVKKEISVVADCLAVCSALLKLLRSVTSEEKDRLVEMHREGVKRVWAT
jgi:hypothetical protein